MAIRTAHGKGKDALIRIETLPVDELPTRPLPLDPESIERPIERNELGQVQGESAKALASRGGKNKAAKMKWLRGKGLINLAADGHFHKHWVMIEPFSEEEVESIRIFSGGFVGPSVQRNVGVAAQQQAISQYYFELGAEAANVGDPDKALKWFTASGRIADYSRQQIATAKELGYRDGNARRALGRLSGRDPALALLEAVEDLPGDCTYEFDDPAVYDADHIPDE